MADLVYKHSCPYCRAIVKVVKILDPAGVFTPVRLESDLGRNLIEDHHGEMVNSPHLFTDEYVYYGVKPVAKAVLRRLPRAVLPIRKR